MWLAGLSLALQAATGAPERPVVRPPRIDTTVAIDGRLEEPVWRTAARLDGFHQYRPVDGQAAAQRTEVLVWYSPNALYFGIIAHDRTPGSIRATLADRDKIFDDDRVIIYLDTFNDRRRAFVFGANPLGVEEDGVRTEGGFGGGGGGGGGGRGGGGFGGAVSYDRSPDYLYQSKGQITDSGYVIEMRIPFKSLRYAPGTQATVGGIGGTSPGGTTMTWGFNVVRVTQRSGFEDTWSDVRRGGTSFLAQGGLLAGLTDIKRGVVTEVQPVITASASGTRDTINGVFSRESLKPDFGMNLRLGFSNLAVDATVNPDFSQVESDAGAVTLNERFALFFPERRPFFLEGIELFQSPGSIVYTRRIGAPVAGAKVTGKFGRVSLAHLTAVDEELDPYDTTVTFKRHPVVNVTRIRTDLGTNSLAGITVTDRSVAGGFSRLVQADTRLLFAKVYAINGNLGHSWKRLDGETRSGPAWSVGFDRTGRAWGFSYSLEGIDPGFEAAVGFVPRVGDVNLRAFNRFSLFGRRGALFEGITFFGGASRYWQYSRFGSDRAIEGDQSLSAFGRIRGGWSYGVSTRSAFVDFDPAYYDGATVASRTGFVPYVGPARLTNAVDVSANASSPNLPWGSFNVRVQRRTVGLFSEASRAREFQVSGGFEVRPRQWARVEGNVTYSRLRRARDESEFGRTIIPRLRLEIQPNRTFLFRIITEYRSQRRDALRSAENGQILYFGGVASEPTNTNRFRADFLLSFQPSQGTVAFLGYGAGFDGDRTLSFQRLVRQDDGLFLKLAYQFRR